MAKEEKAASFGGEEDFSEGGGLVQGDLTWRNPRFEICEYRRKDGTVTNTTPAFRMELEDEQGAMFKDDFWSVGNADDWAPSKDGHKIIAVGKAEKLSKSSNFFQLMKSLMEGGWPKGRATDDVSVFEAMKCHMIRIPAPKREGLTGGSAGKYEKTILVVDKVITLPWEGKGKAGAAKGKAAEAAGDDEFLEKAKEVVEAVLSDSGEAMAPTKVASAVFKKLKEEGIPQAEINKFTTLIAGKDQSFIQNEDNKYGIWSFEKGKASM